MVCLRVTFEFIRKVNQIKLVLEQKPPRQRFHILRGITVAVQVIEKEGADDTKFITIEKKKTEDK